MTQRTGFTLLELSIVLVIIGLIIGGIVVGAEMSRQAELQGAARQHKELEAGIRTFQLKYRAFPGDFKQAESYWTGCTSCNGNGDGRVDWGTDGTDNLEWARAWRMMSFAGILAGSFDGLAHASGGEATYLPNINSPAAKLAGASWLFINEDVYQSSAAGMAFWLQNGDPAIGALTGPEAQGIDAKYDDGKAPTGTITTTNADTTSGCVTGTYGVSTAAYTLSANEKKCAMQFWFKRP